MQIAFSFAFYNPQSFPRQDPSLVSIQRHQQAPSLNYFLHTKNLSHYFCLFYKRVFFFKFFCYLEHCDSEFFEAFVNVQKVFHKNEWYLLLLLTPLQHMKGFIGMFDFHSAGETCICRNEQSRNKKAFCCVHENGERVHQHQSNNDGEEDINNLLAPFIRETGLQSLPAEPRGETKMLPPQSSGAYE